MYEQYTDKQIVEMLVPKLKELGYSDDITNINIYPFTHKTIASIYRLAYARGQLGQSFIIGEKKNKDSAVAFQVGDKVKLINREGIDKEINYYYPLIGTVGKVVELGSDYCFVQWPKGVTVGDGVWACPNHCLEKVTEYWVPATKDNVKVGSKVMMIDEEAYNTDPAWFPAVGTLGIIEKVSCNNCLIQWPKGTTYGEGKLWSQYRRLEVLLSEG